MNNQLSVLLKGITTVEMTFTSSYQMPVHILLSDFITSTNRGFVPIFELTRCLTVFKCAWLVVGSVADADQIAIPYIQSFADGVLGLGRRSRATTSSSGNLAVLLQERLSHHVHVAF